MVFVHKRQRTVKLRAAWFGQIPYAVTSQQYRLSILFWEGPCVFSGGISSQQYWIMGTSAGILQASDTVSGVSEVYGKEFRMEQG